MGSDRLAKVVEDARSKAGLTQRDLAKRSGVSCGYLCRIENAQVRPSDRALRKLARALAADEDTLFAEAGRLPSDVVKFLARRPMLAMRVARLVRQEMKS